VTLAIGAVEETRTRVHVRDIRDARGRMPGNHAIADRILRLWTIEIRAAPQVPPP
jgi:hypothetical protein